MGRWTATLVLALAMSPSVALAQGGARALGSPTPPPTASPDSVWGAPPPRPEVQDITPHDGARRFGDGHERDVPWSDAELDLRPEGFVHFGIVGSGGVLTATSHTNLQPDVALGMFLDVAIVPTLSLHLRLGAMVRGRFLDGGVVGADGRVGRSAALLGRGQLLVGLHLWQVLAIRAGFELGASETLENASTHSGLGWALVSQVGVRVADGSLEVLVEPACDAHELAIHYPSLAGSWGDQPSLRLSLALAGEF